MTSYAAYLGAVLDRGMVLNPTTPESPPPTGYASLVTELPGGAPIAYWRLGNDQEITDTVGNRHGAYTGDVNLVDGIVPNSNDAIDFGGIGQGVIPHDAGLELSEFTLSFWMQANTIPAEEQIRVPILSKDDAGFTNGDFWVALEASGALRFNFQDDTTNHTLETEAELVEAGVPLHVIVRADDSGFDVFVKAVHKGKVTSFTDAWSNNEHPIRFADDPPFVLDGDIVLDEVALFDRVLSEIEIITLALEPLEPPVAEDDNATVNESATTALDVLANDTFLGEPTISIVTQPSGGDSASVVGQAIEYTAGAVEEDTGRTVQYKIEDAVGESNTATVNVTVRDITAPMLDIANCYPASGLSSVEVSSMSALQSAINNAPAGRHILIAPGTYSGGTFTFDPSGTEANPIVVRPRDGRGTVTLNSPTWTLAIGSSRLVLANLFFNNPRININGLHHRITRCRFRGINRDTIRPQEAINTRIDHCDISDLVDNTNDKRFLYMHHTYVNQQTLRGVMFDYNYIHDINNSINSRNSFWASTGAPSTSERIPEVVADHCLFRNTTIAGHGEFLVIKHSGYIVRYCTFDNISGYLQQRHGGGWEVRSCWFEGKHSAPLKCWDWFGGRTRGGAPDPLIIGNRLVNADIWCGAGSTPGADDPYDTLYFRCREGRFIGNIFRTLTVGAMWSAQTAIHPARDNNLWNNTGTVNFGLHTGTTFNEDNEPFTPAVKLTPSDVGMAAPDPLCPTGPQS